MGSRADLLDSASSVRHAYRRWAPVYDVTFGTVAELGRKNAVKIINRRRGRVLEVGVGTGLSLPCYDKHLSITGIDLSPEMLDKARARVRRQDLGNIDGLYEMDAGALAFPDESFDTVVAMHVMTVVPDAEKVMRELERACATGGEVILVNHFSQEEGVRGFVERRLAPLASSIGWHAVFTLDRSWFARICALPNGGCSGPSGYSPCSASSRSRVWDWLERALRRSGRLRGPKRRCRCDQGCPSRSE